MQGLLIHETAQRTFNLEENCVLGRSADCSIQVLDPSISRRHAMIRQQSDGFYYFDLGSFNGSYLNGTRVTIHHKLTHGDRITLGDQVFRFEQTGEADSSEPALLEASTLAQVRSGNALLLVSDVQGFTKLSEKLSPDQLAPIIGSWYSQTEQILAAYGATLDKFDGDSVLAYWMDTSPEHRKQAFRTAGALQRATIDTHNTNRELLTGLGLNFAAGTAIHLGRVACGGMSAQEFTLLGDAVNVVFRLESLTRETGHDVLTSAEVLQGWPEGQHYCTSLGFRYVKGHQAPVDVWAVTQVPG
jgi:adenylate cyclase